MAKTNAELLKEIEELKSKAFEVELLNDGLTKELTDKNNDLAKENDDLKNQVDLLQQSIEEGFDESIIVVDPLTRNDIIKGLLPSLPLNVHNTEAHADNLLNCADILLKKING